MTGYDNWGHVYGIIFNTFNYNTFIKALINSQKKKETFLLGNEENEVLFISSVSEKDEGYTFLIGRTNEEVSKTKFDTKTFKSEDIVFKENEHISDYTHIFISKSCISKTGNSYFLLLEKNQRIQIGSIKKLIGYIIGYKALEDKVKSQLYIGALMQADYIKKLTEHEIIGKQIIINEVTENIIDLTDSKDEVTETILTQVSKYEKSASFLNAMNFLIKNPKKHAKKDIFFVVDDGKTKNKKIHFDSHSTQYVPFFQLPYYLKSKNKMIHDEIVDKFIYITNTDDYETL
ncbi:MAG: hypothetical protein U9R16_04515 [Campylobacterota bacterium]|nr:hypothetical protein [Campylobacterota bacterium]